MHLSVYCTLLGSLSNHDDGENDNVKKQLTLLCTCITRAPRALHVHHTFLVHFFDVTLLCENKQTNKQTNKHVND